VVSGSKFKYHFRAEGDEFSSFILFQCVMVLCLGISATEGEQGNSLYSMSM